MTVTSARLNSRSHPVSASTSPATLILPAVEGRKYVVFEYFLIASGAVTVNWEDEDGVVVDGPFELAANGGVYAGMNDRGQFILPTAGKGLALGLSAAVQVGGHVTCGLL